MQSIHISIEILKTLLERNYLVRFSLLEFKSTKLSAYH